MWANSACDEAERVRILAHETAAHIRCDQHTTATSPAGAAGDRAGSGAYVVLAALGMDVSSSTVECVADWSHG